MIDLEAVRARYSDTMSHCYPCGAAWATDPHDVHAQCPTCGQYESDAVTADPDVIALCDELERLRGRVAELEARTIADEAMLEEAQDVIRGVWAQFSHDGTAGGLSALEDVGEYLDRYREMTPEEAAEPAPWDGPNNPETPEGSRPDTPDYRTMIDALPDPVGAVELVTGWVWVEGSPCWVFGPEPEYGWRGLRGIWAEVYAEAEEGKWLVCFDEIYTNWTEGPEWGEDGKRAASLALLHAIADGQIEDIPVERLAVLGGDSDE